MSHEKQTTGGSQSYPQDLAVYLAPLGRLLKCLCESEGLCREDVEASLQRYSPTKGSCTHKNVTKGLKAFFKRGYLSRFELGKLEDSISLGIACKLCEVYGTHPAMIYHLAAARKNKFQAKSTYSQLLSIPYDIYCENNNQNKLVFKVPQERLEDTSAAILYLELREGGRTEPRGHPGTELIFVIQGEVEVMFENSGLSRVLSQYSPEFSCCVNPQLALHWSLLKILIASIDRPDRTLRLTVIYGICVPVLCRNAFLARYIVICFLVKIVNVVLAVF